MLKAIKDSVKTRKEYIAKVFDSFNSAVAGYQGATIATCPNSDN